MENLAQHFVPADNIPDRYKLTFPYKQTTYLLNGEIKEWKGEFQNVYSPVYVGENDNYNNLIGSYPLMDERHVMQALEAAVAAFDHGRGAWPSMPIADRIECVKKFVNLMNEQKETVVKLIMWEIGKTLKDANKEFDRTVAYICETIEALKNLDRDSSRFVITNDIIAQVRRAPLGVTLCMGPFNYPLNETFTTLIPALIMGNTVLFKPPKLGVLLQAPLLKAFCEAFPKGVVNTVYGRGSDIIPPIMQSGKIDVLAFIGSSKVASDLKKQHPKPHRLKSVLGLDAKNPAIILPDADLDNAVSECVSGALSFNGQRCTGLKMIFVHEAIADRFLEKLSVEVEKLKIGLPWEEEVFITPLPEPNKPAYLGELIADAEQHGAKVVNPRGGQQCKSLFFPAILYPVNKQMRVYYEEQFGPVIPVVIYKDIQEPLDYVVESNYGQQASIFGRNSSQIAALVDTLVNQVCRVNINTQCQRGPDNLPFTGRKDSAEATLSISDALRVFSIRTLVATKATDTNKQIIREIIKDEKSNFLSTDFIL